MLYKYNGIVFKNKKKWVIEPWKDIENPQVHIAEGKKPIWKDKYCIVSTTWHPRKDKPKDCKKFQWLSGVEGEREEGKDE